MRFNQRAFQLGSVQPSAASAQTDSTIMRGVFGWMFAGLVVTGVVSLFALSPALSPMLLSPMVIFPLIIVELGLVFWLSARVHTMSVTKASTVFIIYSALNGVTLAPLALAYTGASVASTFFITSGVFGAMAVYGATTKRDLTGVGSFLFMGLVGIVIASIVNIFLGSSMMSFMISVIGVIVFVGLTAYDVQKIKQMSYEMGGSTSQMAIRGALTLYLDFINLFISLLRLIGDRR